MIEIVNIIYNNILNLIKYKNKFKYTLIRSSLLGLIIVFIFILIKESSLIQEELIKSRFIILFLYFLITFINPVKK